MAASYSISQIQASINSLAASYASQYSLSSVPSYAVPAYPTNPSQYSAYYSSILLQNSFSNPYGSVPTNPASLSAYLSTVLSQQSALVSSYYAAASTNPYISTPYPNTATATVTGSSEPQPSGSGSSSKAWIAGAVIGPIVGIALIVGAVIFFLHRRKVNKKAKESASSYQPTLENKQNQQYYNGPSAPELGGKAVAAPYSKIPQNPTGSSGGYVSELSSPQTDPTGTSTGVVSELSSSGMTSMHQGPPVELPANQASHPSPSNHQQTIH